MTPAHPETSKPVFSPLLDERSLSRLRWGCRRGLLENDLFIERFFARHAATLTVRQAKGLDDLMDLSDNDLLDLFLQRKQPRELEAVSASTDEAREVLALLIVPATPAPVSAPLAP